MFRQFKLVVLVNVVFVVLFVFFNWVGYEMFNASATWMIQTHFPFYIYGNNMPSPMVSGFTAFILPNYLLVIFLISIVVNLYFIYKLQKSKETKTTTKIET